MKKTPITLRLVGILFLPTVGVFYMLSVMKILNAFGYSKPIYQYGWRYFYALALSAVGLVCYTTWSLLAFRPLGRWLAVVLFSIAAIWLLMLPTAESPFQSPGRTWINRCVFAAVFISAAYYLLSPRFRHLYETAKQERRALRNTIAEQSPAGDRLKAPPEE